MGTYLKLKKLIEDRLQRPIQIQVLYEDSTGNLLELISIFERNYLQYNELCESFAERSLEHHIYMFKRHFSEITKGVKHSFVFPYEMTKFHRNELPDIPVNDKAKHSLYLKSKGFNSLPILIAVASNGK